MSEPSASAPARTQGAQSLAWATWSLFVGLGFLLVGAGLFATVVGVQAERLHYSNAELGILGASYYAGFLAGARITTLALARVGHIRVYAALAALLSATTISVGLRDDSWIWISLRFASGISTAGLYVVAESWLNQLATNTNRGRLLAVYVVVTNGAYGIGQLLIGSISTSETTAFAISAILTSLAVVPVMLSEEAAPPSHTHDAKLRLRELAKAVPTGVGTCLLVGITHGALVAMSIIYATSAGLSAAEIGRFVAVTALGGVILQWPISTASDELDRRFVGVVIALLSVASSVWLLQAGPQGWQGIGAMFLLGGFSFPLYSIGAAYTNDWVEPKYVNGAASQLVVIYGLGALIGPLLTSFATSLLGNDGFPWAMIVMHAAIVGFLVYRMFAWRSPIAPLAWREAAYSTRIFFIPANVVWMGRKLGLTPRDHDEPPEHMTC